MPITTYLAPSEAPGLPAATPGMGMGVQKTGVLLSSPPLPRQRLPCWYSLEREPELEPAHSLAVTPWPRASCPQWGGALKSLAARPPPASPPLGVSLLWGASPPLGVCPVSLFWGTAPASSPLGKHSPCLRPRSTWNPNLAGLWPSEGAVGHSPLKPSL